MKTFILVLSFFCFTSAFASERIFECTPIHVFKIKELPEDFNLLLKPQFIYKQSAGKDWSLQVGNWGTRYNDGMGPAMAVDSEVSQDKSTVSYYFQLDGSLEFQFSIRTDNHEAVLYWWGLGEPSLMAQMQCEVIEQ